MKLFKIFCLLLFCVTSPFAYAITITGSSIQPHSDLAPDSGFAEFFFDITIDSSNNNVSSTYSGKRLPDGSLVPFTVEIKQFDAGSVDIAGVIYPLEKIRILNSPGEGVIEFDYVVSEGDLIHFEPVAEFDSPTLGKANYTFKASGEGFVSWGEGPALATSSSVGFEIVDISSDTNQEAVGPVTRWQTHERIRSSLRINFVDVEHVAAYSPEGDVLEFWSSPVVAKGKWQVLNISEQTEQRLLGPITAWQVVKEGFAVENLAGRNRRGELLLFFRSLGATDQKWQAVNVTQETGRRILGSVTSWQVFDGEFLVEHIAGRSPAGELLEFFWSPRFESWQVINVSAETGQKVASQVTNWQISDDGVNVEKLAGRSRDDDLVVFSRSPESPGGGQWGVVNVSKATGQKIGGSVSNWQTLDGDTIVENLAARSRTDDLNVFSRSPESPGGGQWGVVNVSKTLGVGSVLGTPTVYEIFDGYENIVTLGIRDHFDALRLLRRQPSQDWHLIEVAGINEIKLSSDPKGSIATRLSRTFADIRANIFGTGIFEENFLAPDRNRRLKKVVGTTPRNFPGPVDLDCKVINISGNAGAQIGEHQLTWTWKWSGETHFRIESSADGVNWPFIEDEETENTKVSLMDLDPPTDHIKTVGNAVLGKTVYYRVRGYRQFEDPGRQPFFSAYSNVAACVAIQQPVAPTNLSCLNSRLTEASSAEVVLGWNDESEDESSFHIFRQELRNGQFSDPILITRLPANTDRYTVGGLLRGRTFMFSVRAHRESDNIFSNPSEARCNTPSSPKVEAVFLKKKQDLSYLARVPPTGIPKGSLKAIELPKNIFDKLTGIIIISQSSTSQTSCLAPKGVKLEEGNRLTGKQLVPLYGSETPHFPIYILACPKFIGNLVPDRIDFPERIRVDLHMVP